MILANICSRGLLIISGSCAVGNANNTHKTHKTFQCCSLKNISSLWAPFHYLYVVSSNSTEFASYLYGLTLNSFRIYHHIVDDHKQGKGTRFDKHNHWDLTSILFITCQWSFCCCWCCNIFLLFPFHQQSILQLHAWLPSPLSGVRWRVTLLWYKSCCYQM